MAIEIDDPLRIVDLAQAVENDYIGSPCGQLDQIMILFAKEGMGTHYNPRDRSVRYVPLGEGPRTSGLSGSIRAPFGPVWRSRPIGFAGRSATSSPKCSAQSSASPVSPMCGLLELYDRILDTYGEHPSEPL